LFTGSQKFRPVIDGNLGGTHEEKIYIRNDSVTQYFIGITLALISTAYDGVGENGYSGIGFKFISGERRPTEAEWDEAVSGATITIPDIGTVDAADTYTYYPVWVRVYVPGNTDASVIENFILRLYYFPKIVGA
jgi:hypothetical protein